MMFTIAKEPGGMREYLTMRPDFTTASFAAWSPDSALALGFTDREGAADFLRQFRRFQPGLIPSTGVSISEVK